MRNKDRYQNESIKERDEKKKERQRLQAQVGLGVASSFTKVRSFANGSSHRSQSRRDCKSIAKSCPKLRSAISKSSTRAIRGCVPNLNFAILSSFVRFAISGACFAKASAYCGGKLGSMLRRVRFDGVWTVVGVLVFLVAWAGGSEFPERECCDPVYPPNTATTAAAPVTPPITKIAG